VERKPHYFFVCVSHVIRQCIPVIHRGSDVGVTHEFLLHAYRSSHSIKQAGRNDGSAFPDEILKWGLGIASA
jgi:hypothetical protein